MKFKASTLAKLALSLSLAASSAYALESTKISSLVSGQALPDGSKHPTFRNIEAAVATGQQMQRFFKNKGVTIPRLTKQQIRDGNNGADLSGLTAAQREAVLKNTPLWFYVLREAELNGGRLSGVGAWIVAETFHRAMEGSTHSIVRDTAFAPSLGPNSTTFRMVDLLFFAFEGKKALLNPNG